MNIEIELYQQQQSCIPQTGQHILAQQTNDCIIVYQAFNPFIANYAVDHQQFGGGAYSFNRMSWIKPNFLWMMYRCGWALKENQQHVLAIWIKTTDFDFILSQAAYSSYKEGIYANRDEWKKHLEETAVRLQWDPDHDPHGKPLERRAIQLGMKGDVLKTFCTEMILKIEDITPFVKEQYAFVANRELDNLAVPQERVYVPKDEKLREFLGLD
jgi:hypothetical protein